MVQNEIEQQLEGLKRRYPTLTRMELTVCRLLFQLYTTMQIASDLKVSDRTIDAHRRNIRKKLRIRPKEDLLQKLREIAEMKSAE